MDPAKITAFEREFLTHMKTSEQALLNTIATEGKISESVDAKLKSIVQSFLSTFTG